MALAMVSGEPAMAGFSLDERQVKVGELTAFTYDNFHQAANVLKESNTLKGILKLLVEEIDELLKFLEDYKDDRVNIVAEFGDVLHFWNDLFQLSEASVMSLLTFLEKTDPSTNELTMARLKELAVEKQDPELDARDLLYELKVVLRLKEDVDVNLIGVMATHIFAVAAALNINSIYAVLMKNIRNRKKYNPQIMDQMHVEGMKYALIRDAMAQRWNSFGGDVKFFEEFLDQFPIQFSYAVAGQLATVH